MENPSSILGNWPDFVALLPAGLDLEATARAAGAFQRPRGVKDAETLLRLALGYGGCGMSLRECCAWAEAIGIASLSNPALMNRLVKAANWLGDLVGMLLAEQAPVAAATGRWSGYRMRAVDATSICPPGAAGTTWRLHVGYDLASGQLDEIELSDQHGAESLTRFAFSPGDIVLSDRAYAKKRDLRWVLSQGADLIVRTGWNALSWRQPNGEPFDLFAALAELTTREGEMRVAVHEDKGSPHKPLVLRLVVRRKSAQEIEEAHKRLLKEARKRGKKPDPRSLEAAKYIMVLTSLPAAQFSTADVLSLYRLRWQIELAFKRFKSLAGLDQLPAKQPELARAWIYARLITALLTDRIAGEIPDSPPSGPRKTRPNSVTMAVLQDYSPKRSARHSRIAALDHHPQ